MTRRNDGLSMVEVVIAALLLGVAFIPVYSLFTQTSKNVFQSRVSYMAMHCAREELEALRQIPFTRLAEMTHEWEPVIGHILKRAFPPGVPEDALQGGDAMSYPEEYARIQTRVVIEDLAAGTDGKVRQKKLTLQVRWQEEGADPEEGQAGFRKALSTFTTIIADHRRR